MVNLKVLEKLQNAWELFESKINYWIDSQWIASYFLAAYDAERRIHAYLNSKGLKHLILIEDDSEYYRWLKVDVKVYIDLPFEEQMKIWEELDKIARKGMSKMDNRGVYISVEPLEFLRQTVSSELVKKENENATE